MQKAKPRFSFFFTVLDTGAEQIGGITVPFKRAGNPQTINVHKAAGVNRIPCVFGGKIFDEAFSSFRAFQKDQSVGKTLRQPCFLGRHLNIVVVRNGTANVFLFEVFARHADVFHKNSPS